MSASPLGRTPARIVAARLADGRLVDLDLAEGRVAAVRPAGHGPASGGGPGTAGAARAAAADDVLDVGGRLVLPALVEPHAHLDKALLPLPVAGPGLRHAVTAWVARYPERTVPEIAERALSAAREYVRHGVGAIRTHTDALPGIGTRAVEAVAAVRERLAGVVEVEAVAMAGLPLAGAAGAPARAALEAALDAGATVVGGAPWLDPAPEAALDALLEVAAERGLPVDVHLDETTDPAADTLFALARAVRGGFPQPVTASHAVSLGSADPARQDAVAAELSEAGVAVVTLPRTNLWLQTRHLRDAVAPRWITAVRALLDAGVSVAAGADNLRDVFNPHGPADPLDVARLLATVVEVSADEALAAVTTEAARVLRPGPPRSPVVATGDRADLVVLDATSPEDAVARTPAGRLTLHGGRVVAQRAVAEEDVTNAPRHTFPWA